MEKEVKDICPVCLQELTPEEAMLSNSYIPQSVYSAPVFEGDGSDKTVTHFPYASGTFCIKCGKPVIRG